MYCGESATEQSWVQISTFRRKIIQDGGRFMKRQVSLEEISDGRLYDKNDMVKAGCGGCKGCSSCCRGMGESVILDPYDVYRLMKGTALSFEALLTNKLELHVVDGIILPNLNMSGKDETCGFLDANGRCSIHAYRPGICRLFPLGRYYETDASGERTFRYFLQTKECPAPNKTKVKVSKWLDTPELVRYEQFVKEWHYFLEDVQQRIRKEEREEAVKNTNLFLLKLFYIKPYETDQDFYPQFESRLAWARETVLDETKYGHDQDTAGEDARA